jgi:hypothetical protein
MYNLTGKPTHIHNEPLNTVLLIGPSLSYNSPVTPDIDLSNVRSFEKKQELFNILHSEDPDHYSRLYFVGFLKYVGYSLEEICSIIHQEASWGDYDAVMTYCQVRSVFKGVDISSQGQEKREFEGEKPAPQRGLSPSCIDAYLPKTCIIGNTRITCYFKKCGSCPLKVEYELY